MFIASNIITWVYAHFVNMREWGTITCKAFVLILYLVKL